MDKKTTRKQYKKFLRDCAAYISFAIDNNVSPIAALGNLNHDINGVLTEGLNGCFSPRVNGYAKKADREEEAKHRCADCGKYMPPQEQLHGDICYKCWAKRQEKAAKKAKHETKETAKAV
jgi:hypothetical protein